MDEQRPNFTQLEEEWFRRGEQMDFGEHAEHCSGAIMAPLAITGLRASLTAAPERLNDAVLELLAKVPGLFDAVVAASASPFDGVAPSSNGPKQALSAAVVDTDYYAWSIAQQSLGNVLKFLVDAALSDDNDWTEAAEIGATIGGLTALAGGVAIVAHMSGSEYRLLIAYNLAVQIASYVITRFGIDNFWLRHVVAIVMDAVFIQGASVRNEEF